MKQLRYIYEAMAVVLLVTMIAVSIYGLVKLDETIPITYDREGNPLQYGAKAWLFLPLGIAIALGALLTFLQCIKKTVPTKIVTAMAFIKGHLILILSLLCLSMVFGALRGTLPKSMGLILLLIVIISIVFGFLLWRMARRIFQ